MKKIFERLFIFVLSISLCFTATACSDSRADQAEHIGNGDSETQYQSENNKNENKDEEKQDGGAETQHRSENADEEKQSDDPGNSVETENTDYVYAQTMSEHVKTYREDSYLNIRNYDIAYSADMIDQTKPDPVRFDWSDLTEGKGYDDYTLLLSEDESFENAVSFRTGNTYYDVFNLFIKTRYYWKVVANGFESDVRSVMTDSIAPRLIDIDGVTNMRDLGGYDTEDNKVVNQGLIYRSAKLDGISVSGKKAAKETLGIKTEIDLRRNEDDATRAEGMGNGFLGAGVNYYKCSMDWSYLSANTAVSVRKFFEILSDENNYPIVFHCTAGADRTGFMAYLINALLGVEKEDLYDDYQITNFAKQSERERYYNVISEYVRAIDMKNGDSLSEKAYNFLTENEGVPYERLNAVKNIMIDNDCKGALSYFDASEPLSDDNEKFTVCGEFSTHHLISRVSIDTETVYGNESTASIKVENINGQYRTSELILTNDILFTGWAVGDTIEYYLMLGDATYSESGETYDKTITKTMLLNPAGWNVAPVSIVNAETDECVESIEKGIWYKVVYILTDTTDGSSKNVTVGGDRIHFFQGQAADKINTVFYIDEIKIGKSA